jgi:hypothetical protein
MMNPKRIFAAILAMMVLIVSQGGAQTADPKLPTAATIRALAQGVTFNAKPVTSGPVSAAAAPNFSINVYFRAKLLMLEEESGAIAQKIDIRGVPATYGIPDGSYYIWMGKIDGKLRAVLARMDGTLQTELCAQERPQSRTPASNTVVSSTGPLPCTLSGAVSPGGTPPRPVPPPPTPKPPAPTPKPPPPTPREPPKPPPTQKRTIQDICYTEDGNKPVTKYRKGVVWVPDS